jgi:hypothetical protein
VFITGREDLTLLDFEATLGATLFEADEPDCPLYAVLVSSSEGYETSGYPLDFRNTLVSTGWEDVNSGCGLEEKPDFLLSRPKNDESCWTWAYRVALWPTDVESESCSLSLTLECQWTVLGDIVVALIVDNQ